MIAFRLVAALLIAVCAADKAWPAPPPSNGPLGSLTFRPTPERPIGWRGDGTGNYPGATPPTVWEVRQNDAATSVKGVLWRAALPAIGVSSPIIVGEKIFLTSEVSDLVCLDKKTGRVLWIRSNPEFEATSPADFKAEPAYAQNLVPLSRQLAQVDDALVDVLNSGSPTVTQGIAKKKQIEKAIQDAQLDIDKKGYQRNWAQAVFGFSGPTPTSDGKHVCAFFTTGVSVCYDLNGKRQWIERGAGMGSEHGNFASPLICGNQLVVWANEMRGYDIATGKLQWSNPAKAFNTYGSLFRVQSGRDLVAGFQWGFFVRIRDGRLIWDDGAFGDSVTTPIVVNGVIFAHGGYPKINGEKQAFGAFQVPPNTESGKLIPLYAFDMDWGEDVPVDKKKNPFDRGFVGSPLFVNGLIYQVSQGGGLMVHDAATGRLAYRKVLPLHPKTEYWNWAGCGASPTFAGKYIYLMDNQGTTIVIEPGKKYKEVATNVIEERTKDGKEQEQNLATPVFEGSRMYYRTPGYLYCVGKK
jgi:outer membrane protein assembly factor BamB